MGEASLGDGSTGGTAAGARKFRVLHMFSGYAPRPDGLAAYLGERGAETVSIDTINDHLSDQDLLDDAVWERCRSRLSDGEFDFLFAGPPCRSFSDLHWVAPRLQYSGLGRTSMGYPSPRLVNLVCLLGTWSKSDVITYWPNVLQRLAPFSGGRAKATKWSN